MYHNPACKCFSGHHIWDADYTKTNKAEQYCICCGHVFPFDDEESGNGVIEWNGPTILTKPQIKSVHSGGFSKGKVVRR